MPVPSPLTTMPPTPPQSTLAAPAVTTSGGRVELRLENQSDAGQVVYQARFFLGGAGAENPLCGRLLRTAEGAISARFEQEAPPEWLLKFATALLQTVARSSADRGWPRRLTRWRKAPAE